MKFQLLNIWRRSCDWGMPIASNPLPPNLRVLRSVGQAAGPQMVLRHEENNSEPKQGQQKHQKTIWNLVKSHVSLCLNSNQWSLKLCPNWGDEAEICVKGACVTKGYVTWQCESAECRQFDESAWICNFNSYQGNACTYGPRSQHRGLHNRWLVEDWRQGWLSQRKLQVQHTAILAMRRQTIRNLVKAALIGMAWWCMMSGYIDENNYLCLSGRYKEIINRGELKHVSTFVWTTRLKNCKKHVGKQPFWLNGCKQRNNVSCSMMDEKLRWWREDLTLWGSRREARNYLWETWKTGKRWEKGQIQKLNNWKERNRATLWHSINWFGWRVDRLFDLICFGRPVPGRSRMFVVNGHLSSIASPSAVLMRSWERLWDWQLSFGMETLSIDTYYRTDG